MGAFLQPLFRLCSRAYGSPRIRFDHRCLARRRVRGLVLRLAPGRRVEIPPCRARCRGEGPRREAVAHGPRTCDDERARGAGRCARGAARCRARAAVGAGSARGGLCRTEAAARGKPQQSPQGIREHRRESAWRGAGKVTRRRRRADGAFGKGVGGKAQGAARSGGGQAQGLRGPGRRARGQAGRLRSASSPGLSNR